MADTKIINRKKCECGREIALVNITPKPEFPKGCPHALVTGSVR